MARTTTLSDSDDHLPPIGTDDRKIVRKIERDPWNRLRSIQEDAEWVRTVSRCMPHAALVPNLRCGAWYVPPDAKGINHNKEDTTFCYFKSTDGHADQWSFSLKRPNLAVASLLQERGTVIIVDSTRRGKSLPDAQSKTIPTWCAVLTEASMRKYNSPPRGQSCNEDHAFPFRAVHHTGKSLYTPSHQVPASEHSQIHDCIDGWVESLLCSDLPIPRLSKPIVPFFLTRPSTDQEEETLLQTLSKVSSRSDCYSVILLSASRRVDSPLARCDYYYTQGSGDDEEIWSRGLAPGMFWNEENHRRIMLSAREDLPLEIKAIVQDCQGQSQVSIQRSAADRQVAESMFHLGESRAKDDDAKQYDLVIHCCDGEPKPPCDTTAPTSKPPRDIYLNITSSSNSKKASHQFRATLPRAIDAVETALSHDADDGDNPRRVLIVDDIMASQVSVAMATALLACFYTSQGATGLMSNAAERTEHRRSLTKDDIRRRLQWIAAEFPSANPSRELMLKINQVLLSGCFKDKQ